MDNIAKKTNKRLQSINLVSVAPFTIELATGSRALELKELNKEIQNLSKQGNEQAQIMKMCEVISNFSTLGTAEEVFDTLTEFEIMDVYFSIQGDNESIKKLISLTK